MVMKSLGRAVSTFPKVTIAVLIAVTIIAAGFIGIFGIDQEFSESSFMPENEVVIAQEEVADLFSTSNVYRVSILVKDKDRDVLTSDAMVEMLMVERAIINDTIVNETLMNPDNPSANANSVADIVAQTYLGVQVNDTPTFDEKIEAIQNMSDTLIKQTITGILSSNFTPPVVKGMFSMLLTSDFSFETGHIQAKGTMILITLNGSLGEEGEEGHDGMTSEETPLSLSEERMDAIVKDMDLNSTEMQVMGMSIIMEEIMNAMSADMGFLLPAAFILVIIILGVVFRNGWDMAISLTALVMGIVWMYGFGTALGFSFNPMTLVVPILIVGLGIDYGIHLTMRHREELNKGKEVDHAVEKTISHVGTALLLVTVTTMAAFLSNLASPMDPLKDFGIIATIGIISCFFTMVTFVPACLHIKDTRKAKKLAEKKQNDKDFKPKKESKSKKAAKAALDRGISAGAKAAERLPILVIVVVLLISVGAIMAAMNLKTTFEFEDFLPENLELAEDLEYMLNEFSTMGGEGTEVQLLIKGDIADPDLFRSVDTTIDNMTDDEYILQSGEEPSVKSINSLVRDWATDSTIYGFSDDNYDPNFHAMYNNTFEVNGSLSTDATRDEILALYDWLYMNPSSAMDAMSLLHRTEGENYNATVLRISISLMGTESKEMKELIKDIDDDKAPLESSSDSSILTGGSVVGVLMLDLLNESQIRTLILTLIVCIVFMVIVFYIKDRSIMLGIMTMLPVIFCVIWILGTMYVLGISLNIMTLMVTSLTIGIGVDYGIHISHRFGEDIEEFENVSDAMHNTVTHTGLALFGGATTTIAGFGLIAFASMPPIAQFGLITALTILYSSIASVFVLPTFLVMWAKRKRRETEEDSNKEQDEEKNDLPNKEEA